MLPNPSSADFSQSHIFLCYIGYQLYLISLHEYLFIIILIYYRKLLMHLSEIHLAHPENI